jgi:TRAP-type C4-dicarboxylate transport system substrate-binding protein
MRKSKLLVIVSVLALICGMTSFCYGGESTAKPIVIKVNNFMPQQTPPALGTAAACEKLAELSGGTMTAEQYYNGTLLGFADSWQGTAEGAVDVAIMAIATIDSNTLLNNIFSNPVPNLNPSQVKTTEMYNNLVDLEPSLNEEMAGQNLRWLSLQAMPNLNIHLKKKVLASLADVKGIKVEGLGAISSKYWEKLGATTVSLDPGDYYLSCERGIVDGMFTHWACVNDFKLSEVLHGHTIFGEYTEEYPSGNGISTACMGYAVNLDAWNKLSTEQQGWLQEAFRYGAAFSADLDTASCQQGYKTAIANGDQIMNITGDALKPWHDAMQVLVDEWIANCDAKGITTSKQVHNTLMKLVDEYKDK